MPLEYGLTPCLTLSDEGGERFLSVMDGLEYGAVINLSDESTGEKETFTAPRKMLQGAMVMAQKFREQAVDSVGVYPPQKGPVVYSWMIPGELTASPLYAEALSRPSVILYNGQPVIDPTPVYAFLHAVEQGRDGELFLYDFSHYEDNYLGDMNRVFFAHFVSAGGAVTCAMDSPDSWDEALQLTDPYEVEQIYMTDYGYLVYQIKGNSDLSSRQVVNDFALFQHAEGRRQMYHTYLESIHPSASGSQWASLSELRQWIWIYEDIYRCENGSSPFDIYGIGWPVEEMVALLSRYFEGVTPLMILRDHHVESYDADANTIQYEGGREGLSSSYRVTGWQEDGNILAIDYESYDYITGIPYENASYVLTVRLMEDGSFRYLSNQEAGTPVQMTNPVVPVETPMAFNVLGFGVRAPEGAEDVSYSIIAQSIAQVTFSLGGNEYCYRTADGREPQYQADNGMPWQTLSGIYETFDEQIIVEELEAELDGNNKVTLLTVSETGERLAYWNTGVAIRTLYTAQPASHEEMLALINGLMTG